MRAQYQNKSTGNTKGFVRKRLIRYRVKGDTGDANTIMLIAAIVRWVGHSADLMVRPSYCQLI